MEEVRPSQGAPCGAPEADNCGDCPFGLHPEICYYYEEEERKENENDLHKKE